MCEKANLIVVGKVLGKEYGPASYRADVKFRPVRGMTMSTILVEGMVTGDARSIVELRYLGDNTVTVGSSPNLYPDQRYLFFLRVTPPLELGNTVMVLEYYEVPSNDEVPPDTLLRAIWEEHCLPGSNLGTKPTQAVLPLLNDRWRATVEKYCEHY